jgi:dTDP-4-dehydrorhamnose 3,5-epimerase
MMSIQNTTIQDLLVAESHPRSDSRGSFSRLFCENELQGLVGIRRIVQINHSRTTTVGAVRGLHFQFPPVAEMKMVRCLKGRIWDVAVDIRQGSSSFLQYHYEELTPENGRMMIIPEGFAHGFQVLEENSELLYLHTALYTPEREGGIRHDDPSLSIAWPISLTDMSPRDLAHPLIDSNFQGIAL